MITSTKKKKINPMLLNVILVSAAAHIIIGFVLGGMTIVKYIIPDEAKFEEPPAIVEEEPPLEVKVQIQPSIRPDLSNQRLSMKPVSNIPLPQLSVDLPSMSDSFTVSSGLGSSLGRKGIGSGGGIGIQMPEMDFFGAKSQGEKVVFVVHFGPATTTQNGKSNPYTRMTNYVIRKRLEDLVDGLPAMALFNVTAFWANHCTPFSQRMLSADSENKKLLEQWMAPVNPVEGSKKTYGSGFDSKFSKELAQTPWPQKLSENVPSFGPAWYYNYVTPKSVEQQYFAPGTKDATIHWARGLFWALVTQKPDTIYVLTTNYLPGHADHPKAITAAYNKICADLYELAGLKPPTVNVVVLSNVGSNPAKAEKVLNERFMPLIRASKGKGSIIDDIRKFMNAEEKERLKGYQAK